MSDYMIRGTAFSGEVRFFAADTKETVEEARRIHNTSPLCTAALGRLLTAGAMMGTMGKSESDIVTLKIDGDGPVKSITVTADINANVKGLIYNNNVELPLRADKHLDVGSGIGKGMLSVIKDLGLKDPYVGQTALRTGEIAEDLTYYFAESEQVPTSVALGVLIDRDMTVKAAGGFIIQLMPFASEETITSIEKKLSEFDSVTNRLDAGEDPEQIMRQLLGDIYVEENININYRCNCSRDRVKKALVSLGRKELQTMIDDDKNVNLHCDFCNKDYEFTVDELKEIVNVI
ncbi:MAG: Hsp33 family molecular chaperone HslO [Lachnospiraceae bacterium]|nr:Hsp33 family molecular chaperone HslO [Lachnospiraceae bacterium]